MASHPVDSKGDPHDNSTIIMKTGPDGAVKQYAGNSNDYEHTAKRRKVTSEGLFVPTPSITTPFFALPPLPDGMMSATPSLMGIPLELRQNILRHLFHTNGPIIGLHRPLYQTRIQRMARVSKQLREEAEQVYYGNITFYIEQYDKSVHPAGFKFVRPGPLPEYDYNSMALDALDALLKERKLPFQGPRGGKQKKVTKIEYLKQWEVDNRTALVRVPALNARQRLDGAPYPADGDNTYIVLPHNHLNRRSHDEDRAIPVINLPQPAVRPLIHKVAFHLDAHRWEYDDSLGKQLREFYDLRERGFTGLKTLQVVLEKDGFKPRSRNTVDFDVDKDTLGEGMNSIPDGLRSFVISVKGRSLRRCEAILEAYLLVNGLVRRLKDSTSPNKSLFRVLGQVRDKIARLDRTLDEE
ncbi:hypothetical protein BU16DRAFT_545371 [Lophium mytilinum]|uniref:F-box domain-containing protein n=1 Tax=Lophium mytilinum TaxID=390894 RepID=A0A6A6QAA2_9PEZI|nr:hypothetical protein BU16DRAFT_545371 [Lophium mytilinum]